MKYLLAGIVVLVFVVGVSLLSSWLIMVLWNFLAGYFAFKTITFKVAVGIYLLLSIVGGFFKQSSK